ncbi:GNAT family N-acetyltransferase [Paenibacillus methanolicus]|uniref:Acetyltransferase (GNAT) family protein n=1 Tax=Paenibacillus methanolicus TaxID=582686 RepID=A0A5S5C6T9_9BACL|nr:N-acetyltransferase [Paenibacillus methanolicus]TYP74050.1 acetyltransferase (GNAT) family protein [Paenibacillus methanolicus]
MMDPLQIELAPKRTADHRVVAQLIAKSFRRKFQALLPIDEARLGELLAACLPENGGAGAPHMIARMQGVVIGSIGLTRAGGSANSDLRWREALTGLRREYGWLRACKFAAGMSLLHYEPQPGECYIDHLAVSAGHRNLGIGSRLLTWAQQYVQDCPDLKQLSLHVAGSNKSASRLYERHGFATMRELASRTSEWILKEYRWEYMIWIAHGSEVSG